MAKLTGKIGLSDGSWKQLPPLLAWNINRTDGVPCDSFSLTFQYGAGWDAILRNAVRFEAIYLGKTRLTGFVDEYEVTDSREGLTVTVNGRGMAARLLDNDAGLREFYWVRLSDILRLYAVPYGITKIQYEENYLLTTFVVEYGENCWQVLQGFCTWAAGVTPRFSGDGTLLIGKGFGGQKRLSRGELVEKAVFTHCRYGVYSHVTAKNNATGLETTVVNQRFLASGGLAEHRMTIPRRNTCRAGNSSPENVLQASAEKERVLKLTLREAFSAEPGDRITVSLGRLGIAGEFYVMEAESSRDGDGTRCLLTMREIR